MSLESKDATCVGSLCERANSHGTRDFAGDTDLQAPFRNVKCKCAECGITKTKFIKGQAGGGEMALEALGFLIRKGLPYMAKKSVEMGRYYGSETLRKKKAIDYGLKKLTPVAQKVGSEALSQLSPKIRPKKAYKTNREDLGDPYPYKMVGRKRGSTIQEAVEQINDILTDPKNTNDINRIWSNMHGNKHKYMDKEEHWGNFYQHLV